MWTYSVWQEKGLGKAKRIFPQLRNHSFFAEGFIAFAWTFIAPQNLLIMLAKQAILELMACNAHTFHFQPNSNRPVVSFVQFWTEINVIWSTTDQIKGKWRAERKKEI